MRLRLNLCLSRAARGKYVIIIGICIFDRLFVLCVSLILQNVYKNENSLYLFLVAGWLRELVLRLLRVRIYAHPEKAFSTHPFVPRQRLLPQTDASQL